MERNYDEIIAEMLIDLHQIQRINEDQIERNTKFDKRLDLTIKRMVKVEKRLEDVDKRMEQFDKKLEQSIKELKEFSRVQNGINKFFLKEIRKNGYKK
ncbi:MAG: hypothetical protein JST48_01565 [Bacteroidetes bacterium]|nr:hypothetical protein [Bacteroidota bacterium]